uniref:Methyltransferase type 11 n=1 Tax=Caulobacter sp. (strain K31) TaxID=366602 RepID=B0SZU9_CAUSK
MRHLTLLAAAASLAALGACSPKVEVRHEGGQARPGRHEPLRAITKLDCPEKQGELTRISVAADGQSCVYGGQNAEVTLNLVALNGGDAEAALAPIEADLKALMPAMKAAPPPPTPPALGGKPSKPRGEGAKIDLPGIRIDAHDKGADIRIGGLTINANDGSAEVKVAKNITIRDGDTQKRITERASGGNSNVSVKASDEDEGDTEIHANEGGAQIRQRKRGDGVRATLILASDKSTSGYRVVGYEARGPKGGPLAVAVVKAKGRDGSDHDIFEDMKTLVRHNVGG